MAAQRTRSSLIHNLLTYFTRLLQNAAWVLQLHLRSKRLLLSQFFSLAAKDWTQQSTSTKKPSPSWGNRSIKISQAAFRMLRKFVVPTQFALSQLQSTDKERNQQRCKCFSGQGANQAINHGRQTGHKHRQLLYMPPHLKEKGKSVNGKRSKKATYIDTYPKPESW